MYHTLLGVFRGEVHNCQAEKYPQHGRPTSWRESSLDLQKRYRVPMIGPISNGTIMDHGKLCGKAGTKVSPSLASKGRAETIARDCYDTSVSGSVYKATESIRICRTRKSRRGAPPGGDDIVPSRKVTRPHPGAHQIDCSRSDGSRAMRNPSPGFEKRNSCPS